VGGILYTTTRETLAKVIYYYILITYQFLNAGGILYTIHHQITLILIQKTYSYCSKCRKRLKICTPKFSKRVPKIQAPDN
jgi:hypothetical protein